MALTARKRISRRMRKAKRKTQAVIDNLPKGGSFPQEGLALKEFQKDTSIKMDSTEAAQSQDDDNSSVPNGDERERVSDKEVLAQRAKKPIWAVVSAFPKIKRGPQDNPIDIARMRLDGLTQHLAILNPQENSQRFDRAKQEVHKAEVDYNYCLYYPLDTRWRPPPKSFPQTTHRTKSTTKPKLWRSALWLLIERSMKNGTLSQVQDGTLVAAEIPRHISKSMELIPNQFKRKGEGGEGGTLVAAERSLALSESVELTPKEVKKLEIGDGQYLKIFDSPDQSGETSSRSSEEMMINMKDEGAAKEGSNKDEISEQVHKQDRLISRHDNIESTAPVDGIDLTNGSEEGEVADHVSQSESGDAMKDYSSSIGFKREPLGPQQHDGPSDLRIRGQALQDLPPELLQKQLRYFHVGKLAEEVDLSLPAKCLTCGEIGHDFENCAALKCSNCGAYNKHITIRCPTRLKCSKCREDGHLDSSCPYKLKQLSLDEITCGLCRLKGHVESDCELMWRTSGKTWAQNILIHTGILLFCYECGNGGHLGNDCPSRRPGKGLGSSSWTMFQKFDAPLKSDRKPSHLPRRAKKRLKNAEKAMEMKIKGQATSDAPPPDQDNFLHPRKPPQRPATIKMHINSGGPQKLNEALPPPIQPSSINQPFGSYGAAQQSQNAVSSGYQRGYDSADSGEAGFARYNHGKPIYDGRYERRRDRSRSPQRVFPSRDYRGDRYGLGPPPPRREFRGDDLYRPMPSAARDAYRRHRT